MKITIEIEDSVYNALGEIGKPSGISVELFVQRLLTQVVALTMANPDAVRAIHDKSSEVPEYRDLSERLMKPPPQEE
ncbi:unnamed protein product [marine sediment metagenome]|uniref:Ribbon-helix-helix protein CopG domain-containing protein n=1 Tax=marine sediment metagenome TaxID=412755 RepID=X1UNP2_9ZZZZ